MSTDLGLNGWAAPIAAAIREQIADDAKVHTRNPLLLFRSLPFADVKC